MATRSGGERKLVSLIEAAQLPAARSNVMVHGFLVDVFWPEYRLVVEMDSFDFHSSRPAFERDRRRDQVLGGAGIQVLRVTGRQLKEQPLAVIASIAQAISVRGQ